MHARPILRPIFRPVAAAAATAAVSAALAAGGGAAANAATPQWNPQNTVVPAALAAGTTLVVTDNLGNTVTCSSATADVLAPTGGNPAVAGTVDANGNPAPPRIGNCTNSVFPSSPTTATASGQWLFTATSTSTVDASQASVQASIGSLCTITVSNATITGNTWNNTNHTLASNPAQPVPITETGPFCDGATTATLTTTLQLPTTATISA